MMINHFTLEINHLDEAVAVGAEVLGSGDGQKRPNDCQLNVCIGGLAALRHDGHHLWHETCSR